MRGQCPYRTLTTVTAPAIWALTAGAMARGLAGGLDADTYDWRDIASGKANTERRSSRRSSSSQFCRDFPAAPMLTANMFGGGYRDPANTATFVCQTANPEGRATDWGPTRT